MLEARSTILVLGTKSVAYQFGIVVHVSMVQYAPYTKTIIQSIFSPFLLVHFSTGWYALACIDTHINMPRYTLIWSSMRLVLT